MGRPLNARQRAFCKHYIEKRNAALACQLAGYQTKYPDKYGYELLRNPRVLLEIADMRTAYIKRTDIKLERILAQLWMHGSSGERDKETVSALKTLLEFAKDQPTAEDLQKNTIRLAYSLPGKGGAGEVEKWVRATSEDIKNFLNPKKINW